MDFVKTITGGIDKEQLLKFKCWFEKQKCICKTIYDWDKYRSLGFMSAWMHKQKDLCCDLVSLNERGIEIMSECVKIQFQMWDDLYSFTNKPLRFQIFMSYIEHLFKVWDFHKQQKQEHSFLGWVQEEIDLWETLKITNILHAHVEFYKWLKYVDKQQPIPPSTLLKTMYTNWKEQLKHQSGHE